MFCQNCGADIGDQAFCPNCGTPRDGQPKAAAGYTSAQPQSAVNPAQYTAQPQAQPSYTAPKGPDEVAIRFRKLFRDPLYLILTLLFTAAVVLTVIAGLHAVPDAEGTLAAVLGSALIPCLFALALWILFFAGRGNGERFPSGGLGLASGTLNFLIILFWICIVALFAAGILVAVMGTTVTQAIESSHVLDNYPEITSQYEELMSKMEPQTLFLIIGIVLIVLAVILLLLTVLFYGNLHRFAKSMSMSAKTGRYHVKSLNASKNWLIVGAVLSILSAVASIVSEQADMITAAASICTAVSMVLASVLIRKHLIYLPLHA